MGTPLRQLSWLALRRDGESCALIANREGVTAYAVRSATDRYGPFPRAHLHLRRSQHPEDLLSRRAATWIKERQHGRAVQDIANEAGVRHQIVSRWTAAYGPYPSDEVAEEWAARRRAGADLEAIATEYRTTSARVRSATKKLGPFRPPGRRLPEGVVGVKAIAEMVGLNPVTVGHWRDSGRLPEPDFVTAAGRSLWLEHRINTWLREQVDLERCPDCNALCASVSRHRAHAHAD